MEKTKQPEAIKKCVAINPTEVFTMENEGEEFEGETIVLGSSLRLPPRKKQAENNGRRQKMKKKAFDVKLFWDPAIQEIVSLPPKN